MSITLIAATLGVATHSVALLEATQILTESAHASVDLVTAQVVELVAVIATQVAILVNLAQTVAANVASQINAIVALAVFLLNQVIAAVSALVTLILVVPTVPINVGNLTQNITNLTQNLPGTGTPPPIIIEQPTEFPSIPLLANLTQNLVTFKEQLENITLPLVTHAANMTADTVRGVNLVLNTSAVVAETAHESAVLLVSASSLVNATLQDTLNATADIGSLATGNVNATATFAASTFLQAAAIMQSHATMLLSVSAAEAEGAASLAANATLSVLAKIEQLEASLLASAEVLMDLLLTLAMILQIQGVAPPPGGCSSGLQAAIDHVVKTNLTICALVSLAGVAAASVVAFWFFLLALVLEKQALVTGFIEAVVRA